MKQLRLLTLSASLLVLVLGACKGKGEAPAPAAKADAAVATSEATDTAAPAPDPEDASPAAEADTAGETAPGWHVYEAEEDKLAFEVPGEVRASGNRAGTPWGDRSIRMYAVEATAPRAIYSVMITPLREAEVGKPASEHIALWEKSIMAGAGGIPVRLDASAEAKVGDLQAKRLHISAKNDKQKPPKRRAQYLVFVHNNSFVEVAYLPIDREAGDAEATRFFDSVELRP